MSSSSPHEVRRWKIMNREFMQLSDGRHYSRKIEPKSEWQEVDRAITGPSSSTKEHEPKKLYLVLQSQSEGEPFHWSLFAHRGETGGGKGRAWQVKGDAIFMHYQHADDADFFASGSYSTSYELNSDLSESQEKEIDEAAKKELPPQAQDQRSITENCQGWTIRVLRRLVEKGVVKKEAVDGIERDLKEPIRR